MAEGEFAMKKYFATDYTGKNYILFEDNSGKCIFIDEWNTGCRITYDMAIGGDYSAIWPNEEGLCLESIAMNSVGLNNLIDFNEGDYEFLIEL